MTPPPWASAGTALTDPTLEFSQEGQASVGVQADFCSLPHLPPSSHHQSLCTQSSAQVLFMANAAAAFQVERGGGGGVRAQQIGWTGGGRAGVRRAPVMGSLRLGRWRWDPSSPSEQIHTACLSCLLSLGLPSPLPCPLSHSILTLFIPTLSSLRP